MPVIHNAAPHGESRVQVIAGQARDEAGAVLDTLLTKREYQTSYRIKVLCSDLTMSFEAGKLAS